MDIFRTPGYPRSNSTQFLGGTHNSDGSHRNDYHRPITPRHTEEMDHHRKRNVSYADNERPAKTVKIEPWSRSGEESLAESKSAGKHQSETNSIIRVKKMSELLKPGVGQSANPLAIEADESSATVEQRRVMMKYYNILPTTSEFSQKFEKVMEPSEVVKLKIAYGNEVFDISRSVLVDDFFSALSQILKKTLPKEEFEEMVKSSSNIMHPKKYKSKKESNDHEVAEKSKTKTNQQSQLARVDSPKRTTTAKSHRHSTTYTSTKVNQSGSAPPPVSYQSTVQKIETLSGNITSITESRTYSQVGPVSMSAQKVTNTYNKDTRGPKKTTDIFGDCNDDETVSDCVRYSGGMTIDEDFGADNPPEQVNSVVNSVARVNDDNKVIDLSSEEELDNALIDNKKKVSFVVKPSASGALLGRNKFSKEDEELVMAAKRAFSSKYKNN